MDSRELDARRRRIMSRIASLSSYVHAASLHPHRGSFRPRVPQNFKFHGARGRGYRPYRPRRGTTRITVDRSRIEYVNPNSSVAKKKRMASIERKLSTLENNSRKMKRKSDMSHSRRIAAQRLRNTLVSVRRKPKYCVFFNRFGYCQSGDKCPYVHESSRVSVCRSFLMGECHNEECKLSHKVDPLCMPVCIHFLRGICSRDNCPYFHVKVNEQAPICKDFLEGRCEKGMRCAKKHIWKCDLYERYGNCPDGEKCPLASTHKKKS